jgi:hypothetical protein
MRPFLLRRNMKARADDPAVVERQAARLAVSVAREARVAERKAARCTRRVLCSRESAPPTHQTAKYLLEKQVPAHSRSYDLYPSA